MIRLEEVTKVYQSRDGRKARILDRVTAEFPTGRNVGVLGLNGAGKSSLIRLLSGSEKPDAGRVIADRRVSFPLGFASVLHPDLTGRENCEFVAKIYGYSSSEVESFVEDFSELGHCFDDYAGHYSSGMLSRVAFGLCFALNLDVYLIDEIIEVGDGRFRTKALTVFQERALRSDIIIVSHNIDTIRTYCDHVAILHGGRLAFQDSIDHAIQYFNDFIR